MNFIYTIANRVFSLFFWGLVSLFSTGLIGCAPDVSQSDRDESNPMTFKIDDLTQVEACTVYDPVFSNGNLYATVYNKERTVALMIMEEDGGLTGSQSWKEGQWNTYSYKTPVFQVQLLMGRNLGQTPCSTFDQPEEIDQVFLPANIGIDTVENFGLRSIPFHSENELSKASLKGWGKKEQCRGQ